jgi:PII-like signaling protein
VNRDGLKLTVYFGERDRANGDFLADALAGIYARHQLHTSVVIRGIAGFGSGHHRRTDRLLSVSEDLPLVSVAVDTADRIRAALLDVERLHFSGVVTLERAAMVTGPGDGEAAVGERPAEVKLTLYTGRHQRIGGAPAYEVLVSRLHHGGVAGASVLLGVDGTERGVRRRATFFGRNTHVPLMVIAVGDSRRIEGLLSDLDGSLATIERVEVCKRDGHLISPPRAWPDTDAAGEAVWQKLMVYTSEDARYAGRPLHHRLLHDLRGAGAAGATTLRGTWG